MNAIPLTKKVKAEAQSSLTKRVALGVFKTVRAVAQHAQKVPSHLTQSVDDIQSAWRETYHPNV